MKQPTWVARSFVLALHEDLLAEFGGAAGIRDEGMLESALSRPQHLFDYGAPDLFELGAAYAFGIVANHPFVDGNKRTGFMTAYVFLVRNGWELIASEPDATAATVALASKAMNEQDYAKWLRDNCRKKHSGVNA
jgi:death on curing protein